MTSRRLGTGKSLTFFYSVPYSFLQVFCEKTNTWTELAGATPCSDRCKSIKKIGVVCKVNSFHYMYLILIFQALLCVLCT